MQSNYPEHTPSSSLLNFGPKIDAACEDIYKACKGFGTDEEKLTEVLGSLSATERYMVCKRYPILHEKELIKLIKSETSGTYGRLLQLLCLPIEEAEATMIRNATKGLGTNEKHLYPLLCGRSNEDMLLLKQTYFKMFDTDLAVELHSELSGDLKQFIMFCLQTLRVEMDPAIHNEKSAEVDAKAFYDAGQGKWGTDEKAFFNVLCSLPAAHLKTVDVFYARRYGYTMERAIKKELSGKVEDAVIHAHNMVIKPFDAIAKAFEITMKGFGTDEHGLNHCIVRYHHVLPQVMEAYESLYGKSLRDRIHGETSGKYRTLLLEMIRNSKSPSIFTSCQV